MSDGITDQDLIINTIAIDCEMVHTETETSALARVCAVAWNEEVILDTYVAPSAPVTDYLTRYSGIRECDLVDAPPADEVRAKMAEILQGRVVVGHGVQNDLRVLHLKHPANRVIDTVQLEWGSRPLNLKALSLEVLGESIQRGGHSPYEDAIASLRLLKAHRTGAPPPKPIKLWLSAIEQPAPPGCTVAATAPGENAESTAVPGCAGTINTTCRLLPSDLPSDLPSWTVTLEWSIANIRELLRWYGDGAHSDPHSCARAPLRFAPTLSKEHREQVFREAQRLQLNTHSMGVGPARAVCVLPRGTAPPQPSATTSFVARLVYRWARDAAEQHVDGAAPAPFSLGEVIELVEQAPHASPASIAPFIARARSVMGTVAPQKAGEACALRALYDYERCLALIGRVDSATRVVGGKPKRGGKAMRHSGK